MREEKLYQILELFDAKVQVAWKEYDAKYLLETIKERDRKIEEWLDEVYNSFDPVED